MAQTAATVAIILFISLPFNVDGHGFLVASPLLDAPTLKRFPYFFGYNFSCVYRFEMIH